MIIPGSSISVYDDFDWVRKTIAWLKEFDEKYPTCKFLGICYGAQIIAEALGGKCDMMKQRKENKRYYLCTTEKVTVNKELFAYQFVKDSKIPITESLNIMEAHGDEIVNLPPNFINYGYFKIILIFIINS